MQEMDLNCGWSVPTNLACNRLLSPPQLCAASTMLTASKDSISDSVPANGYYSASSSCSWTINMPDQPYITLNFTSFDTEELYDVVTVEVSSTQAMWAGGVSQQLACVQCLKASLAPASLLAVSVSEQQVVLVQLPLHRL